MRSLRHLPALPTTSLGGSAALPLAHVPTRRSLSHLHAPLPPPSASSSSGRHDRRRRRVGVTGLGVVSPLATGAEATWAALLDGRCAVAPLIYSRAMIEAYTSTVVEALPCKVAAAVRRGPAADHAFDIRDWAVADGADASQRAVLGALQLSAPDCTQFALAASVQAMRDAAWLQQPPSSAAGTNTVAGSASGGRDIDHERTGVAIGVGGLGSMHDVAASALALRDRGYSRVSAYFLPRILPNMTAGQVALHLRLTGPVSAPSGACATGAQAIGEALRTIQYGDADVMLAGGADASLDPLSVAGFVRCRALSASSAASASRPFHARRDGFVMGEGAAVLVLEELEHALRRRAPRIYAEVCGYASRADPSHLTSPSDAGDAAFRVMAAALDDAGVQPHDVDYLNAHATSTPAGDRAELRAVRRLFGGCDAPPLAAEVASEHSPSPPSLFPAEAQPLLQREQPLAISSTKGATGHLLGAAGALESAFCVLAIRDSVVPPTLHLDEVDAEFAAAAAADSQHDPNSLNLVPLRKQARRVDVAMNNSFGFGGVNACLVFRKPPSPPPTV